MKRSSRDLSIRSLVAVVVVVGLSSLILHYSSRFYYDPICKRYAESRRLTFVSSSMEWVKQGWPAECFFDDRNGNSKRVEVATMPLTSGDWVRWVLRWVAVIAGVGGSVWLASVIGGFKPGRRRSRREEK